jgi:hypothetical protein
MARAERSKRDGERSRLFACLFFGHGSGKYTWSADTEATGTQRARKSKASVRTSRRLGSPSRAILSAQIQKNLTAFSTPMNPTPGRAAASRRKNIPLPVPISISTDSTGHGNTSLQRNGGMG